MYLTLAAFLIASQATAQDAPSKPTYSVPPQLASMQFVPPLAHPDYTTSVIDPIKQAQAQALAACNVKKGHLDGLTCVLPPPPPPQPAPAPVVASPVPQSFSQPSDWYKAWIYNEESGNNPTRWNAEGCLGLGQACPASKLLAVCPTMDYGCEDTFFTNYMLVRYGSWQNAYDFHIAKGWW